LKSLFKDRRIKIKKNEECNVYNRNVEWKQNRDMNVERVKLKVNQDEMLDCLFKPETNNNSSNGERK